MYYYLPHLSIRVIHHADSIAASSITEVARRKDSTALLEARPGSKNGNGDLI